jgi:hypothetical protein
MDQNNANGDSPTLTMELFLKDPRYRRSLDLFARLFGSVMLVASAVCTKFFIFDQLESIRQTHLASIEYLTVFVILPPILATLGLVLAVGGGKCLKVVLGDQRYTPKRIIVMLMLLIPAFVVHSWFDGELKKMGYQKQISP